MHPAVTCFDGLGEKALQPNRVNSKAVTVSPLDTKTVLFECFYRLLQAEIPNLFGSKNRYSSGIY